MGLLVVSIEKRKLIVSIESHYDASEAMSTYVKYLLIL